MQTIEELTTWDISQQEKLLNELKSKEITPSEYLSKVEAHSKQFREELFRLINK